MYEDVENMELSSIIREGFVPIRCKYIWDFPIVFEKEVGDHYGLKERDDTFWMESQDRWVLWPVYALFKMAQSCLLPHAQLADLAQEIHNKGERSLMEIMVMQVVDTAVEEMEDNDDFEYLVLAVGMTNAERRRTAIEIVSQVPKAPI